MSLTVFLVIMACMEPEYNRCQTLHQYQIPPPKAYYWCLLNRPAMAAFWQHRVYDGWLTFTECRLVDMED